MTAATALALYVILALGAIALYLLLPQPGRPKALYGIALGAAALGAWIILLAARILAADASAIFFCAMALIAVVSAVRVVTHTRPLYSALYFVLVVVAVAGLLVLQRAEFLAVALIIIYAGAIMVTYLFVIMLAEQPGSPVYDRHAREPFAAVVAGFLVMAAVAGRAGEVASPTPEAATPVVATTAGTTGRALEVGNTIEMGASLMGQYIVVVELAGVLLLVAMIGAIAMARKCVPTEGYRPVPPPVGKIGREVRPF